MVRNGTLAQAKDNQRFDPCCSSEEDSIRMEAHVLAVDDSLVDRKVIERLLKTSSCKVTTVDSGRRALQILGLDGVKEKSEDEESSEEDKLKIDLIITDYCMPEMTGYELLKKIKESSIFRETPVVIMSSENVLARIHRCLEEGAEDFIVKPVKLSDVKRLLEYMTAMRQDGMKMMMRSEPNTINVINSNKKRKQPEEDCASSSDSAEPSFLSLETSPSTSSPHVSASHVPEFPDPTSRRVKQNRHHHAAAPDASAAASGLPPPSDCDEACDLGK